MKNKYSPLFEPIKIGNVTIKNRYALSPMALAAIDTSRVITPESAEYFIERARGGVGLIFTGAHMAEEAVEKKVQAFPVLTHNPEASIRGLRKMTERIHAYGTKIFIQVGFGLGRNGVPQIKPEDNIAPSETTNYYDPRVVHRALTTEEVYRMIKSFAQAAKIAQQAGADGIEVHCMHGGYLLDCFTMACFNQRTDEFGGDLRGRATLPIKLVEAVKEACGKDFPVSIRLGIKSFINGRGRSSLPGVPFAEQGRDTEESLEMAKILEEAGYDCLNVDCGSYDGDYWGKPPVYMPEATYLEYAEKVKAVVNIPVLVSGRLGNPDIACEAVRNGQTDMIVLGRPLLADPELPRKVQRGEVSDIRPCVACLEGCWNRLASGVPASCAINPQANRETEVPLYPAAVSRKALVVGGGPAGMEAARVLALRGHSVTLVDASDALGGKYRFASLSGFKDADAELVRWYIGQMEKLGVQVLLNHTVEKNEPLVEEADVIITATGATPAKPPIPGLEKAEPTLNMLKKGEVDTSAEYTVIGAGLVGCEVAIWLAQKGIRVHLIEMANEIVPVAKPAKMNMQYIREALEHYEIDIHLGTKLKAVEDDSIVVEKGGKEERINTQKTIYSFGFRAVTNLYDELAVSGKEVYNIGDAKKPGTIMPGIWDAYEVCRTL